MVDQVALNTNIGLNSSLPDLSMGNQNILSKQQNSIFDMKTSANDYENDFMMSGLFAPTNANTTNMTNPILPQQQTGSAALNSPVTSFQGSEQAKLQPLQNTVEPAKETEYAQNSALPKISDVPVKNSNVAKTAGGILGFLAPIAGCAVDLFKGVPAAKAFNLKQLAVTCPLVALAGLGIGMFVDGFINTKQAQKAAQQQAAA